METKGKAHVIFEEFMNAVQINTEHIMESFVGSSSMVLGLVTNILLLIIIYLLYTGKKEESKK